MARIKKKRIPQFEGRAGALPPLDGIRQTSADPDARNFTSHQSASGEYRTEALGQAITIHEDDQATNRTIQPKSKVISPMRKGSNPSANEIASKLSLKEAHRGSRKSQISE